MNKVAVRVIGLVVAAALIAALVLFGRQQSPEQMRLALVPNPVAHPHWQGVRDGMLEAATEHNVRAFFQKPSEASVEGQLRIIEDLIAQGYDGIAISPNDPQAVQEIIGRAIEKGIAVITLDSDSPASDRLLHIGTDNRQAGRIAGRLMIELLGAKPREQAEGALLVQVIGGQPGAENLAERMDGFKEAVKGTSIALCDDIYDEGSPDTAIQVAENAVNAHPDLRGFFCASAFGGPGAALAIKGAIQRGKLKPNQIRVVAFGATPDILNHIEEGVIDCALAQQGREMGRLLVERLVEFATQHDERGEFVRPPKGRETLHTGVAVVRRDDVAKYRAKPADAK